MTTRLLIVPFAVYCCAVCTKPAHCWSGPPRPSQAASAAELNIVVGETIVADEATETTIVAMPPPACYPLRRVAREYGPAVLYIYAPSEALISIDGDRLPREAKPFRVVHLAIANPRGCDVAVSARVEQTRKVLCDP